MLYEQIERRALVKGPVISDRIQRVSRRWFLDQRHANVGTVRSNHRIAGADTNIKINQNTWTTSASITIDTLLSLPSVDLPSVFARLRVVPIVLAHGNDAAVCPGGLDRVVGTARGRMKPCFGRVLEVTSWSRGCGLQGEGVRQKKQGGWEEHVWGES